MKILTVIGARPQFIKAAAISRAITLHNQNSENKIEEIILHTGQHFDTNMSDIFFDELDLPKPDFFLGISGLGHGAMTGRMIEEIEQKIIGIEPNFVLVYGDTNSTLAAAIAASKLEIPIIHIESGLRSHNLSMPEEVNRILTDRISSILICPTKTAVENLKKEGFPHISINKKSQSIHNFGDVMLDATLFYQNKAKEVYPVSKWDLEKNSYALCTIHRQENVDNIARLKGILLALNKIREEIDIFLPLHPRTKKTLYENNLGYLLDNLTISDPLSYLQMQSLEMSANFILTDSGGVQKEAFFHKVPCITLRDETEWIETVSSGWNTLAGADKKNIISCYYDLQWPEKSFEPYGKGETAKETIRLLTA